MKNLKMKSARVAKDLTQQGLADAIGVSRQTISAIEKGDYVLTTSGFYGVIIDITDEDVIVEFGNNKNCRISMQKSAIAQVEKPSSSQE